MFQFLQKLYLYLNILINFFKQLCSKSTSSRMTNIEEPVNELDPSLLQQSIPVQLLRPLLEKTRLENAEVQGPNLPKNPERCTTDEVPLCADDHINLNAISALNIENETSHSSNNKRTKSSMGKIELML